MKKKILFLGILLTSIVFLESILNENPVLEQKESLENTELAIYVDDEKTDTIPSKDSGYILDMEKSTCTYGSVSWDINSWGPVVTVGDDVNGKVRCTLYFKEATDYDLCVAKYGKDSIQCKIIAGLDTTGACPEVSGDDILIEDVEETNAYICSAPDDYGTSYYFRGTATNNYVLFAGYYWRILRINGDDSIRLIYDGTTAHQNGETSEDRQIGTSIFNDESDDNAYVGYMYGTVGASSYEEAHANIHDSTIKGVLDNWYTENIVNKGFDSYINDTLFCNDRVISEGVGYGKNTTYYRWYDSLDVLPKLKCAQQNDRFTVNDEVVGNGDLTYPIGLITADEIAAAGSEPYGDESTNFYLYTGTNYWTMTSLNSSHFSFPLTNVLSFESGYLEGKVYLYPLGVRPVINLKPNSLKSGDGSSSNPYKV